MELIIGGSAQGKLAFALTRTEVEPEQVLSGIPDSPDASTPFVVNRLEEYIRHALLEGKDPFAEILTFAEAHPQTVFVCREVGCGVVPADPFERKWREAVGRICTELAGQSEHVFRVACGIARQIK